MAGRTETTALSNLLSRLARRWYAIAVQPSYALLKHDRIARQQEREVDVVICVHNALDYVRRCLASVLDTLGPRHRIIVVDDASEPEVGTYLRSLSERNNRLLVYCNTARSGYSKSANIGLRLSGADFVILLNSDTVVAPNWIEKLCDAVYTTEGAGIVGPLSNAASFQSIPDHRPTAFQTAINKLPPDCPSRTSISIAKPGPGARPAARAAGPRLLFRLAARGDRRDRAIR